jgi:CHAT domain-containing protein
VTEVRGIRTLPCVGHLLAFLGLTFALGVFAQTPAVKGTYIAPPAIRYNLVGVLPARLEHASPSDHWLPLALYETLTTMIWRTPGVRPMTRSPVGVVMGRACPEFSDACLANMTAAQHLVAAKQLYAEVVVSPVVVHTATGYRLKLLVVNESGVVAGQLETPWKVGDLAVAQRLLFEVMEQARQKGLLARKAGPAASDLQINNFDAQAAQLYSDVIRDEWIQEKKGVVATANSKLLMQKRIELLKRATDIDAGYYGVWNALGFSYAETDQLELASVAFKKALDLQPGHVAPRAGQALVALLQKDFRTAANLYSAAFLDAPGLPELGEVLTHSLANQTAFTSQERLDYARSFRRYLAAQRPQAVWSQELAISWTEYNLDNNVDAEVLARRVVSAMQQVFTSAELDRNISWGQANEVLGRALYDQDRESEVPEYLEEAIRVFERVYEVAPKQSSDRLVRLYSTYVDTLETLKQYESALLANERAGALIKEMHGEVRLTYVNSQRIRARLLNKLKRFSEAENIIGSQWVIWNASKELAAADRLRILTIYTHSLEEQKKFTVSLPFLEQRLAFARQLVGSKEGRAGDLNSALRDLGDAYYAEKNHARVLDVYGELLDRRRTSQTVVSATDAFLMERVAVTHGRLNQVTQGAVALNKALAMRKALLAGADTPALQKSAQESLALSHEFLAGFWRAVSRPREAIPLLEKNMEIRRQLHSQDAEPLANALDALGKIYYLVDRNSDALKLSNEALAMRTRMYGANDPRTLDAREQRADVLNDSDKLAESGEEYFVILQTRERVAGKNNADYLVSLDNVVGYLRNNGDYSRALAYAREGLDISSKLYGAQGRRTQLAKSSWASVLLALGRYGEVVGIRREFLSITQKQYGDRSLQSANGKRALAQVYAKMGQHRQAFELLTQVLETRLEILTPDASDVALAYLELGDSARKLNQSELAAKYYDRSMAIYERNYGANSLRTARVSASLASLASDQGDFRQAIALLQAIQRIELVRLPANHPDTAATLNNIAANYSRLGSTALALPMLMQATLMVEAHGNPSSAAIYNGNLAHTYAKRAEFAPAILFGKRAINHLQQVRAASVDTDKDLQRSLIGSNSSLYRFVADLLAREGRIAEAQEVLSMLKEEEYFSFIRRDTNDKPTATLARLTPAEAPWLKRYQELGSGLTKIARDFSRLREAGLGNTAEAKQLEADVSLANEAFERITAEMLKSVADQKARQLTSRSIETQSALQETLAELSSAGAGKLSEQVALVQYVLLPERLAIFVTTPQVQVARESPISTAKINQLVSKFREVLLDPKSDPLPLAQELYRVLIAPIKDDLAGADVRTIMLSPDGSLRYLPFAALHDGDRYLVEKANLALFTAAASDKLKDKPSASQKIWGLGLTKEKPGFSALTGVKRELESILSQTGGKGEVHFDEAFTEQALQSGLAQKYPVLHIASHFKFSAGTEADSFLLLGDGSKLSLQDVRRRYRFAGVDLLTLSACETAFGGGEDANGREVDGFATLAQMRGAKAVLATLWPVADDSTSQLMQALYVARDRQKLSKAAALRHSQLGLLNGTSKIAAEPGQEAWRSLARARTGSSAVGTFTRDPARPYAHPYYWAPFILMGNWL